MDLLTLKELCTKENITRRTIQGYENAGLLQPSSRTKRGYLLYDTKAQERVKKVHLFQKFGFSIKEIKELIDAPNEEIKENLCLKQNVLLQKNKELENTILEIMKYIETLDEGE